MSGRDKAPFSQSVYIPSRTRTASTPQPTNHRYPNPMDSNQPHQGEPAATTRPGHPVVAIGMARPIAEVGESFRGKALVRRRAERRLPCRQCTSAPIAAANPKAILRFAGPARRRAISPLREARALVIRMEQQPVTRCLPLSSQRRPPGVNRIHQQGPCHGQQREPTEATSPVSLVASTAAALPSAMI